MSTVPPTIAAAYDPDSFRTQGHRLIDAIGDALGRWHRRDGLVLPWRAPDDALAFWARKSFGGGDLVDDLRRVMAASTALAHPRCMAHQVPPPLPGAALAELVSALLNNGMAVYEMGPASVPIELAVIDVDGRQARPSCRERRRRAHVGWLARQPDRTARDAPGRKPASTSGRWAHMRARRSRCCRRATRTTRSRARCASWAGATTASSRCRSTRITG